ncbi:hypothetical protein [Lentzea sp. NPDC004782]|uniref:hypothetical protein n=1 Tax=Lentzea sp. NPDC004782 TaxID=3154458 RepID=UPI0033A59002
MSGEINWEAYSHEQLHRMLWQDADVADVSTVAEEWTRHREALDAHAAVLKEQRAALLDTWHGTAAEEAAARLTKLAERIERISAFAAAGQRAAQEAADALAAARAAMPPPPEPTTPAFAAPFTSPGAPAPFALPGAPAPLTLPSASAPFAPAPFSLPSAPAPMTLPTTPASATGGFYFYFGAVSADQQKAEAVRAMRTYEQSLNGSGRLIDDARGTIPQQQVARPRPSTTTAPPLKTPSSGGVPWQRLVGGTRGPVFGAPASQQTPQAQLSPGTRAGVMTGHAIGPMAQGAPTTETRQGAPNSSMAPHGTSTRKDDDQEHENQMPTLDHGLFVVNERVSPAVIGEEQ